MCSSDLNICQAGVEIDPNTCRCEKCPPDKKLCENPYPDSIFGKIPFTEGKTGNELNRCISCCPGRDAKAVTKGDVDVLQAKFTCECACKDEFDLKECLNSQCDDGKVCAKKYPPDNFIFTNYEWNSTICDWDCKQIGRAHV